MSPIPRGRKNCSAKKYNAVKKMWEVWNGKRWITDRKATPIECRNMEYLMGMRMGTV